MKKQLVIIGIVVILVCIGFTGCDENNNTTNDEKNKFIGTWQNTTQEVTLTMNLFSDGNCSLYGVNGTWDLRDGKFIFVLLSDTGPLTYTYNYVFSNNDRTLSISPTIYVAQPSTQVFTKQ
jgi:hypothetical protein